MKEVKRPHALDLADLDGRKDFPVIRHVRCVIWNELINEDSTNGLREDLMACIRFKLEKQMNEGK